MPLYTYQCPLCPKPLELWFTIEEMECKEAQGIECPLCAIHVKRVFAPRRHVKFHEATYEHIGPDPIHITTSQQLVDECNKNGNRSAYMEDMGGLFGVKKGRWV